MRASLVTLHEYPGSPQMKDYREKVRNMIERAAAKELQEGEGEELM